MIIKIKHLVFNIMYHLVDLILKMLILILIFYVKKLTIIFLLVYSLINYYNRTLSIRLK